MNVKTIVTIASDWTWAVVMPAGIFLLDRSQQQEPPSAEHVQQEEKEEAPVESSSQSKKEQEQSSQETNSSSWRRNLPRRRETRHPPLANAENPLPRTGSIQTEEVQNGYEMTSGQRLPCGR